MGIVRTDPGFLARDWIEFDWQRLFFIRENAVNSDTTDALVVARNITP
jgi:hypothetical protein